MLIGRFKIAMQVQSMELNISALSTQFTLDILFLFFSKQTQIYTPVCQLDADFPSWRVDYDFHRCFKCLAFPHWGIHVISY